MSELFYELLPHFPNLALLSLAVLVIGFLTVVSSSDEADSQDGRQETRPRAAKINLRS